MRPFRSILIALHLVENFHLESEFQQCYPGKLSDAVLYIGDGVISSTSDAGSIPCQSKKR